MTLPDLAIERYYRRLDGLDAGDPVELLADDFAFTISSLGAYSEGGIEELRGYLAQRGPNAVGRTHGILHASVQDRLEVIYGEIVESGETRTGTFVGAAETNSDGLLVRYTVIFSAGLFFPAADRLRAAVA